MFSIDSEAASPTRRRGGTALIGLVGLILAASSITKLVGVPAVVQQFEAFGFGGKIVLLGILEATTAVLFLLPRTRSLGLLMISAFLGGAIATHLQHGLVPFPPAIVLALAWAGVWLRHPVVFWSFDRARGTLEPNARVGVPELASTTRSLRGLERVSIRVSQVVLGLAALVFFMIGRKYILDPVGAATSSGFALASSLGVTNMRAGVGGFALGCGIVAALCVPVARRATIGLWFLITVVGTVFVVRVFGVLNDGTAAQSRPVLTAEAVLVSLSAVALILRRAGRVRAQTI
jgi:hypothetical protein